MFYPSSFKTWSLNSSSIPFTSSSILQQNNVKCSYSWHFPVLNPSVLFPLYLACSCTSIEHTNPSANCPCLTLISHHFPSHTLRSSKLHFQQLFEDDTFSLVYDISLFVWCSPSIFLHLFLLSPHTLWLISFISSDLSSNVISSGVSILVPNWRWTGKPGVLQSIGSQRIRHD